MAITDKEIKEIRDAFDSCTRPVIVFDDDPDGLSSFLMVYKYLSDGKGVPVKSSPEVKEDLARKVNDYDPDLVIILDKPLVSQEFIDKIKAKMIWIDHHPVVERKGIRYYNPLLHDSGDSRPTSYWVYKITQKNLWIAMVGIVGDWFLPEKEILDEFTSAYPDLLSKDISRPEVAIHDSRLGDLIRVFAFNLKGRVSDVMKSVKVLTRIDDPYEILDQTSSKGRFVFKKYDKLNKIYKTLLKGVKVTDDELLVYVHEQTEYSFSAILSNELIYKYPDKFLVVAWEYDGEYKCSLRSVNRVIPPIIEKALEGIDGYGGGHDHAAGSCIKVEDFNRFIENIRKQLI